ncbi:DUF4111 domain-containing protein, partial [Enterobacter hormaechei subsp. steigerwaltii]|nr:DUF4111 domain-containing protein [Enterobacter hormaechei subsp. steigerwaltii]
PAYGPQNDVTLKMPAFEWVHVQLHQQKGMISLSPPTICNSALFDPVPEQDLFEALNETLTLWNSPPDWAGDERNVVLTLSRIW